MFNTVFLVHDIFDNTVYIAFANEQDAENYIKIYDPDNKYMSILAYHVHQKLT